MTTLNDIHLTGVTNDGNCWHTIRQASGNWQSNWDNIGVQEGANIEYIEAIGCSVNATDDLHFVATTYNPNGGVHPPISLSVTWHTIRFAADYWQSGWGNVTAQEANNPGPFNSINCAASTTGDLHVVVLDHSGTPWHTIRLASGSWQANWGNVAAQEATNPGPFSAVPLGCATNAAGDLHVVALDHSGTPWHTIRLTSGSWQANWGNVAAQEAFNPGPFSFINCTTDAAGDLHVLGVVRGTPWHTIRLASGSWQSAWDNIDTDVPGNPSSFKSICGTTNAAGDLHTFALDANGALWHTIRLASGSWQSSWDNVSTPGSFALLSAAS